MKNQEIAGIFNEIAGLLEIKGENPFRIRAYRRAALNIEGHAKNIADLTREELLEIPGIGKDLADKIEEYLKTGKIASYEDLKKEVPAGLADLLSVPSLGPKTAKLLHEKLKIKTLTSLKSSPESISLPGFRG